MKNKNKSALSLIIVLLIIAIALGATFAYWRWVVDEQNKTILDFSVANSEEGIYANLEGNGTTVVEKLQPTNCNSIDTSSNKENVVLKPVIINYYNETERSATITATLEVTEFNIRSQSYIPEIDDLKYIKYALTTTDDSCSNNLVTDLSGNEITGDLSEIAFSQGIISNLPLTLFSQTITIDYSMTEEDIITYYLWIWLDSTYDHLNIGNNNTDPLQGLTFTTQWSGTIAQN